MVFKMLIHFLCLILCFGMILSVEIGEKVNTLPVSPNSDTIDIDDFLNKIQLELSGISVKNVQILQRLDDLESRLCKIDSYVREKTDSIILNEEIMKNAMQQVLQQLSTFRRQTFDTSGTVGSNGENLKTLLAQKKLLNRRADMSPGLNLLYNIPKDCSEVKQRYGNSSGVYTIQPPHSEEPVEVYCNQESRGGGWTVIHNRFDGSVDFHRNWQDYRKGFGNANGEYWLGLDYIHLLTNYMINEIQIVLEDQDKNKEYALYDAFIVESESKNYRLAKLGTYSGTAGDSFISGPGESFTTYDRDNDKSEGNCAFSHFGGWWFKACYTCNLNGKYLHPPFGKELTSKGIVWDTFKNHQYSLKAARMMIRPRIDQVTKN